MTEEFVLSKYRFVVMGIDEWAYREEDVKLFIRRLNKDFDDCRDKTDIWDSERWDKFEKMFRKRIVKLAGDKLK